MQHGIEIVTVESNRKSKSQNFIGGRPDLGMVSFECYHLSFNVRLIPFVELLYKAEQQHLMKIICQLDSLDLPNKMTYTIHWQQYLACLTGFLNLQFSPYWVQV